VRIQKEEFQRLGIFGEWEEPYLTMTHEYEAETARLLGRFVELGSVYKGLKPVHWCISCETALAEAEVEYAEHSSPSVYVKFPVASGPDEVLSQFSNKKVAALIWTTTPWTLPANLAICFHPAFRYSFVEVGEDVFLVAEDLVSRVAAECDWNAFSVRLTVEGSTLSEYAFRHPWIDRESKAILADYVTLEQGTGAVHTAPGHGHEDYVSGMENGLDIYNPVGRSGRFDSTVDHFEGEQVFEANPKIVRFMQEADVLVKQKTISHSYPHCWRCHNPVIFRATPQWFIEMDNADLRKRALEEIANVEWLPAWGEERIQTMVANRPDWCISRQRVWGVPIPVVYCKSCSEPLLDAGVIDHVADLFEQEGADAWYARSVEELLPAETACRCGCVEFEKEFDILDVWFDSGSSQQVVLGKREDLPWPADVYLEGPDQYRGWFHSSLLVALGARDASPYRTVICNGWTLDKEGRAMSKHLGNVISPLDIMKENGAEIIRLWVSSINYMDDVRLGDEILSRLRETYRKFRNTQRFLLGNVSGFRPEKEVSEYSLEEIDRWALARLADVSRGVRRAYEKFEFHVVYRMLYNFCILDLSSLYLDVLKDRLYVLGEDSDSRRAAQATLFTVTDTLARLLAPILPFTSEEVWENLHLEASVEASVHLTEFRGDIEEYLDPELLERWERLRGLREQVMKALEFSRQNKDIGNSLDAMVRIGAHSETLEFLGSFPELRFILLVSEVELLEEPGIGSDELSVEVLPAPGKKCDRCWHVRLSVGTHPELDNVCSRCYSVLESLNKESV
jgi:isoleucyl-tRNA synthetase